MTRVYWVKFAQLNQPQRFTFYTQIEMFEELGKWIYKYGWIEWMQLD